MPQKIWNGCFERVDFINYALQDVQSEHVSVLKLNTFQMRKEKRS